MKRSASLLFSFLPFLPSCSSQEERGRPLLEDPRLGPEDARLLDRVEKLFLADPEKYPAEKRRLLAARPKLGPWLAKGLTVHAVKAYDHMIAQGVQPRDFMKRPEAEGSFLRRAGRELLSFGEAGRRAIFVYLLRSPRAQVREVGRFLLEVQPGGVLFEAMERELREGTGVSQREVLELCRARPLEEGSRALLERALLSKDWQVRASALEPLARVYRLRKEEGKAGVFWKILGEDGDPFVRRKALRALGVLGDPGQVRPLLQGLRGFLGEGREEEAKAAGAALEALTGRRHGTSVRAWERWLGGR